MPNGKTYEDVGEGVLFTQENEEGSKRPKYTGNLTIKGVKYNIAGWDRVGNSSGKKFVSIKVQQVDGGEEDIPF